MYFIPVFGMPSCSDIMHASYYSAYIDGYAIMGALVCLQVTKRVLK